MNAEKQERIKNALIDLNRNGKRMISIRLIPNNECNRERLSEINIINETVELTLVQPRTNEELDKWAELIVRAEEEITKIEKDLQYECNHPDFFKSVCAHFDLMTLHN